MKKKMVYDGKILISYQPLESMNLPNFFRIALIDPELNDTDLDKILILIDDYGKKVMHDL